LRALDRIQKDVFGRVGYDAGEFEYFARSVENYFLEPEIVALDEYGVPIEIARKLRRILASKAISMRPFPSYDSWISIPRLSRTSRSG
jgi:hypothetical protein